jgi:hypothetical protein
VLTIPSISIEYAKVPITVGPSDMATLPVHMAIVPDGQDPTGGDWKIASWIGINAAVLIGPGTGLPLTKGVTYGIWVKITDAIEAPILGPYPLHIT